jgi:hypothetical protein
VGEAGVSVYEILKEKKKLPVEDWVDLEDLGMDDDTHDVGPVEMATPAPKAEGLVGQRRPQDESGAVQ